MDSWQAPNKPPAYGRGIPPGGRCRKPRTAVQVSAFPATAWSLHRHRVQLIEETLTLSHQDLDGFTHQHIWRQDTRRLHGNCTETQTQVSRATRQPQPPSTWLHAAVPHLPLHLTATSQIFTARSSYPCQQEAPTDSISRFPKQAVTHRILTVWMLRLGRGTEPATHAGQSLLVPTNHVSTLWKTGHLQM